MHYVRSFTLKEFWKRESGIISPDGKYFFLSIPKNASSWLEVVLIDVLGWRYTAFSKLTPVEQDSVMPLMVWRDPKDRWISGTAHYINEEFNGVSVAEMPDIFWQLICKQIVLDDHNDTQIAWLIGIRKPVTCFEFGESLGRNVIHFLNENGYTGADKMQDTIVNPASSNSFKDEYKEKLRSLLEDRIYYNRFIEYHKYDYEVLTELEFYNVKN